jgi:hypothetical protein
MLGELRGDPIEDLLRLHAAVAEGVGEVGTLLAADDGPEVGIDGVFPKSFEEGGGERFAFGVGALADEVVGLFL